MIKIQDRGVAGRTPETWATELNGKLTALQNAAGPARQQAVADLFELRDALGKELHAERHESVALYNESHPSDRAYLTWPGSSHVIGKGREARRSATLDAEQVPERIMLDVAGLAGLSNTWSERTGKSYNARELVPTWAAQADSAAARQPPLESVSALAQVLADTEIFYRMATPSYDAAAAAKALGKLNELNGVNDGVRALNDLRNFRGDILDQAYAVRRQLAHRGVALAAEILARPDRTPTADERVALRQTADAIEELSMIDRWYGSRTADLETAGLMAAYEENKAALESLRGVFTEDGPIDLDAYALFRPQVVEMRMLAIGRFISENAARD